MTDAGGRKIRPHAKRRPGSVDQLPAEIKTRIHRLLESGWTKTDITDAVNAALREAGLREVSRQAIGRYTRRVEDEGAKIREINAAAEQFAARAGSIQDAGASAYVKQLARMLIVDRLHEADSETPIQDLSQLVLAIRRIEGSAEQIDRRAREAVERAEEAARRRAADKAGQVARGAGLSAATEAAIRAAIEGS